METLTIEPQAEEKLLIYENIQETNRITQEAQTRATVLNRIFAHKIKSHQIAAITNTAFDIGKFIFELQLKENSKLKELIDAGIKNAEATLPEHLQRLKDDLTAWYNYKGHPSQNKFAFLKVADGSAAIDSDQLEKYFIQRQLKIFIDGDQLNRFRKVEQLGKLLQEFNVPWNHVSSSSVLSKILTANGQGITPNWRYFQDR